MPRRGEPMTLSLPPFTPAVTWLLGINTGVFLLMELFAVAGLYYLAMTTAWDFVQRAIERRFGRAYERAPTAPDQR